MYVFSLWATSGELLATYVTLTPLPYEHQMNDNGGVILGDTRRLILNLYDSDWLTQLGKDW